MFPCKGGDKPASLQDILKVASEIKTKQLAEKRKDWESAPEQFKASLWSDDTVKTVRQASPQERLDTAKEWKEAVCRQLTHTLEPVQGAAAAADALLFQSYLCEDCWP